MVDDDWESLPESMEDKEEDGPLFPTESLEVVDPELQLTSSRHPTVEIRIGDGMRGSRIMTTKAAPVRLFLPRNTEVVYEKSVSGLSHRSSDMNDEETEKLASGDITDENSQFPNCLHRIETKQQKRRCILAGIDRTRTLANTTPQPQRCSLFANTILFNAQEPAYSGLLRSCGTPRRIYRLE